VERLFEPQQQDLQRIETPVGLLTYREAAQASGLHADVLRSRVAYGVPFERLFSPPRFHKVRRRIQSPKGLLTASEFAHEYGLDYGTVKQRLQLGWSARELLYASGEGRKKIATSDGPMTVTAATRRRGMSMPLVHMRIKKRGWAVEDALSLPSLRARITTVAIAARAGVSPTLIQQLCKQGRRPKFTLDAQGRRVFTEADVEVWLAARKSQVMTQPRRPDGTFLPVVCSDNRSNA
jgi:hypothetical protein